MDSAADNYEMMAYILSQWVPAEDRHLALQEITANVGRDYAATMETWLGAED